MAPVIYIMGVSGSGKTTIGKLLSKKTALPFFDGDDFHPAKNKAKMKAGNPLTDDDRQQWLYELNTLAIQQSKLKGAIIACSALKEKYRVILAQNLAQTIWIFLKGTYELIHERMQKREHYMPATLLRSQFNDLEMPAAAFAVDINKDPVEMVAEIAEYLNSEPNNK